MNYRSIFLSCCFLVFISGTCLAQEQDEMSNAKMETILKQVAKNLEGEAGTWKVEYGETVLLIITDEKANRMRIFTPIINSEEVDSDEKDRMLSANFHSALDAKYSVSDGFVISIFNHPLKELETHQLIDALRQVSNLAHNFGTTYSSTELAFPGGAPPPLNRKKYNTKPGDKKL